MDDRLSILSAPSAVAIVARLAEEAIEEYESMTLDVPGLTGTDLGPIDNRYLARSAWPMQNAQQVIQYRKFAQLMVHRIRAGESNDEETERFTYFFNWTSNWMYLIPVLGMLPELNDFGPTIMNDQMDMLVAHVENVVDRRTLVRMRNEELSGKERPPVTATGVTEEVKSKISRLLLGPEGEANASPAIKRLLVSWVEVGYPKKVIQQALDDTGSGRGLARNDLGLPTGHEEPNFVMNAFPPVPPTRTRAPPTANSNRKNRIPIPGADPNQPDTVRFLICPDERTKREPKTSYRRFPHTAIESSPEFSESPPKPLSQNVGNKGKIPTITVDGPSSADEDSSFWGFHKSHQYEYSKYLEPVTEADRVPPTIGAKRQTTISTEKTKDGMIVAKGFDTPPPAESDTCLKGVIENQDAVDSLFFPEDEAGDELGDEALYEEESSDERKARLRRKKFRLVADGLSNEEPLVGRYPSAQMGYENSPFVRPRAPARPPGLPILGPHQVIRECVVTNQALVDATNALETMVMADDESFVTNPYAPSSWKPLGESQVPLLAPRPVRRRVIEADQALVDATKVLGNMVTAESESFVTNPYAPNSRKPLGESQLPLLEPGEVRRKIIEADQALADTANALESIGIARDGSFATNSHAPDSWKPLGESQVANWGPKKIGAQSLSPDSDGYAADEDIGKAIARTA